MSVHYMHVCEKCRRTTLFMYFYPTSPKVEEQKCAFCKKKRMCQYCKVSAHPLLEGEGNG